MPLTNMMTRSRQQHKQHFALLISVKAEPMLHCRLAPWQSVNRSSGCPKLVCGAYQYARPHVWGGFFPLGQDLALTHARLEVLLQAHRIVHGLGCRQPHRLHNQLLQHHPVASEAEEKETPCAVFSVAHEETFLVPRSMTLAAERQSDRQSAAAASAAASKTKGVLCAFSRVANAGKSWCQGAWLRLWLLTASLPVPK